jgi:hypothetical protein
VIATCAHVQFEKATIHELQEAHNSPELTPDMIQGCVVLTDDLLIDCLVKLRLKLLMDSFG